MLRITRAMWLGVALYACLTFGLAGQTLAFHDGGVAHCDGCHTMHNSPDNPAAGATNNTLLKGTDASSTCLNCHAGAGRYRIKSIDGSNVNQGGDFYWMTLDYTVIVRGNPVLFSKDNHGHNIIATDFGMLADANPNNATAPGGTYPAVALSCISCHDPHGQVNGGTGNDQPAISVSGSYGAADPVDGSIHGNYRLLGDTMYSPPGGTTFTNGAPVARATNSGGPSYGWAVDYGSGMSEWCANCHTDYINDSHKHPAGDGQHLNGYSDNYNSYVATGDFTGIIDTAFDALVPFERGIDDGSLLAAAPVVLGADASSNVMCLTCHRAHASANANAGKWDFEVEFLVDSHALVSPDVPVGSAVYYKDGAVVDIATEYGPYQRSLCNKCHVKD